ncbi:diaminopimelate decarboxylase [Ideonella sp. BN130291]|uniref:diaminopimelate decarboxylase n=1 Tax=Ideonella sp. BN130291 TaxID=3112940 RepID=UPI002E2612B8|nr:diaminopimelate decarboxylase [Ideonella sp. BN130291]
MPSSLRLPGAPFVARRGDALYLEDCRLSDLAHEYGTPLYVYSRSAMRASLAEYADALAGRRHLVCYAMKANSSLAVLQTFAQAGCGFDIVSGGELERVLAIGVEGARIVFSGVGKTRAEMRRALEIGVRCFNVESEAELEVLSEVAQQCGRIAPVSLRVNPDVDAGTHPYISTGLKGNKFGIAHDRALAAYRRATELPSLRVAGIDCHIGSQITELSPYLDALDRLLDLVEAIEQAGIPVHHVDVGGGLGISYKDETPPPAGELVRRVLERMDARGHGERELVMEPGRSLVGNAGVLLTEALYLKPGEQKNFCIVDAAMNDLMRPAMYEAWMDIVACEQRHGLPQSYDVVGPVCESGDWLGRDRLLSVQAGDMLAVLSAGAYGMAMASNYNTRPRAAEVMVEGDRHWLIRERETHADLFRHEHLLPR